MEETEIEAGEEAGNAPERDERVVITGPRPRQLCVRKYRAPETWLERICEGLLENAAQEYASRRIERGRIESWLEGDTAPISFEHVCAVLHLDDAEAVKRYIREHRTRTWVRQDERKSAA